MLWNLLIVDDDPTVHKLITKKLPEGQYTIRSLFDSSSALEEIRRTQPHLVILDLMMPHLSGIEICRQIKEDKATQNTLILILSAKESQADRIKGLEIGADDYISKPFHLTTLVRKIEYMLSKGKTKLSVVNSPR